MGQYFTERVPIHREQPCSQEVLTILDFLTLVEKDRTTEIYIIKWFRVLLKLLDVTVEVANGVVDIAKVNV